MMKCTLVSLAFVTIVSFPQAGELRIVPAEFEYVYNYWCDKPYFDSVYDSIAQDYRFYDSTRLIWDTTRLGYEYVKNSRRIQMGESSPRRYPSLIITRSQDSDAKVWISDIFKFDGDTTGMEKLGIQAEFRTDNSAMLKFPLCLLSEVVTKYPSIVFRRPGMYPKLHFGYPDLLDDEFIVTDSIGDTINR